MPNQIDAFRSGAAGRAAELPIGSDLVFHLDLTTVLAGELLRLLPK